MPPAPQPAPLKLLCIDDDTTVLDMFTLSFNRDPDLMVRTSASPVAALEQLKEQPVDAIFCDYAMPEMDGITFLKEIRKQGNDAFFVIITGRHLARVAIDTLNFGGNYYLQKGLTLMDEMQKVIDLIRKIRDSGRGRTGIAAAPSSPVADGASQTLIDNQFVPVCGFDRDGRIRYTNTFYDKEIGLHTAEGEQFFTIIPEDERVELITHLKSLTAASPAVHLMHHVRADGSLRLVLGNYRAFMDGFGEVMGYTALLTPMAGIISLSTLALHSLEEPKARPEPVVQTVSLPPHAPAKRKKKMEKDYVDELADAVEHVAYPVFAIDVAGKIIAWNRATTELTGVPAADMIGKSNYTHAEVLTGERRPMLIDYIAKTPHDLRLKKKLGITHDGDVFHSEPETVKLRGMTVHLWSRGAGIYDARGSLIAAVQSILVSTEPPAKKGVKKAAAGEAYIGGISSIILKVTDSGMGGAIAGAIGSAVGGYGVYVTDRRLFVIHNPTLDARRNDSITFGEFILGELFGTNVDTSPRAIEELENRKVFEVWKKDITKMVLKPPKLLAGSLTITTESGGKFRVYIDHAKAYNHLGQVLMMSYPEILTIE